MSFGLIVGICAMTSIYCLGRGAEVTIVRTLESLNFGANSFLILAGGGKFFGPSATRRDRFKMGDIRAIERFDFVEGTSPVQIGLLTVSSGKQAVMTRVIGVFPVYETINNWGVSRGRFISWKDIRLKTKVCVLGYETAKKLFSGDPIGKKVKINNVYFEVVGILERKGVIGTYRLDDRVLVPFTTARYRIFNKDWIDAAKVLLRKGTDYKRAEKAIERLLRKRHKLLPTEINDFRIITPEQIISFLTKATRAVAGLLLVISIVTLVVSGVIIMNIMYSVVEEKKKIIALRKAFGATSRDIMLHYLAITGGVSVIGGSLGYGLGTLLVVLIDRLTPVDGYYNILLLLPALGFSLATGVLFGLAPARAAASLPPAELLR